MATRDDTPPFEISSQARVRHLNADRVDSMSASQLSHAYHYVLPKHALLGLEFKLTGLPKGTYLASYQIATVNAVNSPTSCNLADTRTDFALVSFRSARAVEQHRGDLVRHRADGREEEG